METEYVRLVKGEKNYGYKNLLHSQLEFLNSMKSFKNYIELRKEEIALKVSLKSRIGEILTEVEKFESMLPKTHFIEETNKKKEKVKMAIKKEPEGLMEEINTIKEKLYGLQREI